MELIKSMMLWFRISIGKSISRSNLVPVYSTNFPTLIWFQATTFPSSVSLHNKPFSKRPFQATFVGDHSFVVLNQPLPI
ncbi:hypothetical protein M0813_08049 [Anaeramoeba flamelloides]|uniref:Uncharacterized protein n=1 Tax=Anaeramoeba flamelloides TaxID=1746091 RepID=A0ABQ8X977_9EUKA|nr:hypothetical protein M0813_08049 [Anaeramoeba flamelloides]